MDSINLIKGYNKVNHQHENQSPPPQKATTQKRLVAAFGILFVTLIIGSILGAVIHESNSEPPPESSDDSSALSSSNSVIKTVCSVTQYPDSCFSTMSSLNISTSHPDPETILKLSLHASVSELSNLSSSFKRLGDVHSEAALSDCLSQFEDAMARLNDSLSEMEVGSGEKMLTERRVNDIQTWISAAMTDQDTCLDGLEEMGSKVIDEVKSKTQKSKEMLSNSLAIIAHIHTLLSKFGLTMH